MPAPLLTTKLYFPPTRSNLIPRPRLMKKLSESLAVRLTLVSAPTGFGKTTLVASWAEGLRLNHESSSPQLTAYNAKPSIPAWLNLDEDDNDPMRFFAYLVAALQRIEPTLGQGIESLLRAPQLPPIESLVITLLNELAETAVNAVLVLDDYHLISNKMVHEALIFLVEQQPQNFHLVLLTREDPPLPLPKLRARGETMEIREGDLRFSLEEATDFLTQTMGLTLSQEEIDTLSNRTEGWIAGLQMAALALQGMLSLQNRKDAKDFIAAFRGDDRYVMDYLMDEVFRLQSREIQDFLMQTSILDRMCASLCDVVLEDKGKGGGGKTTSPYPLSPIPFRTSQEILEYLERANLFIIPLDNKREWYRYHHLFADLLHYRLEREKPEYLPELHRRASRWYVQSGDPEQAMKHALSIPDHALAADLSETYLLQMTGSSRITTYLEWVQQIPVEVISARAYLCAGCGWAYVLTNQLEQAEKYVQAGEAALPNFEPFYSAPDGRRITLEEVHGNLAAIRSYAGRLRNDFPSAIEHAQIALEALPPTALAVRSAVALNLGMLHMDSGELEMARQAFSEAFETAKKSKENIYVAVSALSLIGGIAFSRGKLNEAAGVFYRAIEFGTEGTRSSGTLPGVGAIHGWLVALHYQRNEIAAAQEHLDIVLRAVGQLGAPEAAVRAYLYQALLAQSRGEFRAAEGWHQKAEELMRAHQIRDLLQTEWIVFRGQLYLVQGDLAATVNLLEVEGVQAGDLDGQPALDSDRLRTLGPRLAQYMLLARVLLAQGAFDQASGLLERVCNLAEPIQNIEVLLEALVFQAVLTTYRHGDPAQALAYIERALTLAAPEGYVSPFLKAGEPLAKILRQAIVQDIQPAYAHKLLTDLADHQEMVGIGQPIPIQTMVTPSLDEPVESLTEREKQVLRLLAADLSSTEVAEELVIAVSTVRSYIKSIYRKLDVHSREEAIEKCKRFNLF